jgi:choline dehydrogenase-like flavoprotein
MLADLNTLDPGQQLEAGLVIVGAGAAGITLALEFAGTARSVLLVESGGLDGDADTQGLDQGDVVGMAYEPLESARARYFGGSTNMWTGWCRPLDPIDLQARPALGIPGWPIQPDELEPFYRRAQPMVDAGPYEYNLKHWTEAVGPVDDVSAAALELTFWQKSPPVRFGERYLESLRAATNVTVLLNANLTGIVTGADGAVVDGLAIRSLAGKAATVRGRCFVLACGGLENPRLLLSAAPERPQGLGNDHDLVGRFFMEHPHWDIGTIYPSEPYYLMDKYHRHVSDGRMQSAAWAFTGPEQGRLGVSNCCVGLGLQGYRDDGIAAAAKAWHDLRHGRIPDEIVDRTLAILGDIGGISESIWRKFWLHRRINRRSEQLKLLVVLDAKPNPDSRVRLGPERDALGMPRLQLDWRLSADDERSMASVVQRVAGELTRLGHGRVRLHVALQDPTGGWARAGNLAGHGIASEAPEMEISWHHIGTTRMAASPREGVVDGNCRVHGTANLYVAGSSVFPTAGTANPTLTIVALALRLGDHLKQTGLAT